MSMVSGVLLLQTLIVCVWTLRNIQLCNHCVRWMGGMAVQLAQRAHDREKFGGLAGTCGKNQWQELSLFSAARFEMCKKYPNYPFF